MQLRKAARVILVGAPGVGKGTQTERLLQRYTQLSGIASGDLLRTNVREKTKLGQQVEKLMADGALVPDALILRLITTELRNRGWLSTQNLATSLSDPSVDPRSVAMTANDNPNASYILDGFPRTASQAEQLDQLVPINMVVHIHTPASIVLGRIANRWVHAPSGRVYNTTFNPPKVEGKDDVTGEPLSRRQDDNEDVWKKRLSQFEETSRPLLEHYDAKGILWRVQGNSSNEISPQLFEEFGRRFGAAEQ